MMSRFARERRVFYVEEPFYEPGTTGLKISQSADGVWRIIPVIPWGSTPDTIDSLLRGLFNELFAKFNIGEFVLWYYTPMAIEYTRHLEPLAVVYDCMDELSAFKLAPPELIKREAELLKRADLIFTGGHSLYQAKRRQVEGAPELKSRVYEFPSSVDVPHFAQARQPLPEPADQAKIPHPRLGFFGVVDERMDLALVRGVAEARPDWHLVILGPVVKIDESELPRLPNIHYLGGKQYKDLPAYLAGWAVALLPFAKNESTRFISPTKTPEYLAGGKPVVSTSIRDVVQPYGKQGLVRIADGVLEFVKAIEASLKPNPQRAKWLKRVDNFLSKNSWDRTWEEMSGLIQIAVGRRRAAVSSAKLKVLKKKQVETGVSYNVLSSFRKNTSTFDYLIVGAGFAGSVIAERLAAGAGKRVLLIDKRNHIGGNAYDHYNEHGILVHKYGPHIFHTNSREVFDYLSRFTQWRLYEHRVLAHVDNQLLPIPINLDTINKLYGWNLTSEELEKFFASVAEPRVPVRTSEDVVVSKVGRELYEKFFRNYTRKQWGIDPSQLDAAVTARVPTRTNRDDRYFTDTYQAMPLHGYTWMFEQMLNHPNIKVMLNTDYREVVGVIPYREVIYTGPVDEYFDYRYGKLPYRSLEFKHETLDREWHQRVAVVNYPNEHDYTRITEFKHLTGQVHPKTSIVYEFPHDEGDPYYPVPRPENTRIYQQYKALAEATPNVHFVGRLATYKYYNMDQVVAQALTLYSKIIGKRRVEAIRPLAREVKGNGHAREPLVLPSLEPKIGNTPAV